MLPSRADIDPGELLFILPYIYLLNVLPHHPLTKKYSFRLFGTGLVDLMRQEFTQKTPHEALDRESADAFVDFCERVTESRAPCVLAGPALYLNDPRARVFEFCQMPLIDTHGDITMHLGGLVPDDSH